MSACVFPYYVVSEQTVPVPQNLQLNTNLVMSHQGLKLQVEGRIRYRGQPESIVHGDEVPIHGKNGLHTVLTLFSLICINLKAPGKVKFFT